MDLPDGVTVGSTVPPDVLAAARGRFFDAGVRWIGDAAVQRAAATGTVFDAADETAAAVIVRCERRAPPVRVSSALEAAFAAADAHTVAGVRGSADRTLRDVWADVAAAEHDEITYERRRALFNVAAAARARYLSAVLSSQGAADGDLDAPLWDALRRTFPEPETDFDRETAPACDPPGSPPPARFFS